MSTLVRVFEPITADPGGPRFEQWRVASNERTFDGTMFESGCVRTVALAPEQVRGLADALEQLARSVVEGLAAVIRWLELALDLETRADLRGIRGDP